MIQLNDPGLSQDSLDTLASKQAIINEIADFNERVRQAKTHWKNGKNNAAFREVKDKLKTMSSGSLRCGYCEDSYADEIEHIAPKDFYPERTFDWTNYLYACGPCNSPKGNQYAIFREIDGLLVDHTAFVNAPPAGDPVFINPREEDPAAFIKLDLAEFRFVPRARQTTSEAYQRASYTVRVLRLNERDHLVEARENHFVYFHELLAAYVRDKNADAPADRLDNRRNTIIRSNHQSVWREMQRQHALHSPDDPQALAYPQLHALFTAAPEALNW